MSIDYADIILLLLHCANSITQNQTVSIGEVFVGFVGDCRCLKTILAGELDTIEWIQATL